MADPSLRDLLAGALDQARPDLAGRLQDDPAAYLELVTLARDARSETDELLHAAVVSARRAGCTWEQVGGVLGMTRQAVQQRFGRDADAADADAADAVAAEAAAAAGPTRPAPERRTLAPVTAFTEMAALRRLGRFGWHAVWFGALYFDLERTDRQWEHRRQLVWQGRPEGPGWQPFGPGWFPWAYFARPLDEPALVPPPGYDPFET